MLNFQRGFVSLIYLVGILIFLVASGIYYFKIALEQPKLSDREQNVEADLNSIWKPMYCGDDPDAAPEKQCPAGYRCTISAEYGGKCIKKAN